MKVPVQNTIMTTRIAGFPNFNVNDIFPPLVRKNFSFTRYFTVTGSTTVGDCGPTKNFILNGLSDPDLSGDQPYGYSTYLSATGPYKRYKVCGVRIKVTAVSPGNPCYLITQVRNVIDTYSVAGATIDEATEKPGVRVDFVSSSGPQSKQFNINLPSLAPLFNWDNNTFNIDMGQTTGPYNGLPGSQPYILFAACYPTVASRNLDLKVEFMFDAVCYDRQTLA